jgi:hypothetical protein
MNFKYRDDLKPFPNSLIEETIDFFKSEIKNNLVEIPGIPKFKLTRSGQTISKLYEKSFLENNIGISDRIAYEKFDNVAAFCYSDVPKHVKKWIATNIDETYYSIGIQGYFGGTFLFPHIDIVRVSTLNYILYSGGNDVRTCFYDPKEEWKKFEISERTYIPYERLNLVGSIPIETHRWHLIKRDSIYSIENLDPLKEHIELTLNFYD